MSAAKTEKTKLARRVNKRTALALKIVFILVLIAFAVAILPRDKESCGEPFAKDATLSISTKKVLTAEVASTEAAHVRGLSGRPCIPKRSAMLFTFEAEGYYGIWMKSMKFPIDVVWLDGSKKVVDIEPHMLPESYPRIYTPRSKASFIIEMHDGQAAELGITTGTVLSW